MDETGNLLSTAQLKSNNINVDTECLEENINCRKKRKQIQCGHSKDISRGLYKDTANKKAMTKKDDLGREKNDSKTFEI